MKEVNITPKKLKKLDYLYNQDMNGKTYRVYRYKKGRLFVIYLFKKIKEIYYVKDTPTPTIEYKDKKYKYSVYARTPKHEYLDIGKKWLLQLNMKNNNVKRMSYEEVNKRFKA